MLLLHILNVDESFLRHRRTTRHLDGYMNPFSVANRLPEKLENPTGFSSVLCHVQCILKLAGTAFEIFPL